MANPITKLTRRSKKAKNAFVIGLVAPPQIPHAIVESTAKELPKALAEYISSNVVWKVETSFDPHVPDVYAGLEAIDEVRQLSREKGWDLTVCITDLPLKRNGRVVVGYAVAQGDIMLLSLPAVGFWQRQPRILKAIVQLIDGVVWKRLDLHRGSERSQRIDALLTRLLAPIRRITEDDKDITLCLETPAFFGHVQLVAGMLRANRPWRLIPHLSYALVSALGTATIALINVAVWQLAAHLSWVRLLTLGIIAIGMTAAWLIVTHDLWQRHSSARFSEHVMIFNVVTVLTLVAGILCLYLALFVLSLIASWLVVDRGVFSRVAYDSVGLADYFRLAWLVSSIATVGGALGAGLENKVDVREAAYSYHKERKQE
ncbi:MAG: hypothetical protein JWL85_913 [Candidatus Saccharibacteria bacterium]|nr:hypothetical protein [Candidatus Saccharibacteria bacterium]